MIAGKSNRFIFDARLKAAKDYWIRKLSLERGDSNVKLDFKRPKDGLGPVETVSISLPEAACQKLAKITSNSDWLSYTFLLAVLKVCLQKYSGSRSIVVGSPSRRREDRDGQPSNVLAIINEIDVRESFRAFLLRVQETLRESYEHQDYPFVRLVQDLNITPIPNKCPLFDVALALSNIHVDLPEVGNDLTIILVRSTTGISGDVVYRGRLFREDTVKRFIRHYFTVLNATLENVDTAVCNLPMLTASERHGLLVEWNDTRTEYGEDGSILQLFEEQARKSPDAVALSCEGAHLSYGELNRCANRLGHYLRARRVGPEVIVGIYLERGLEMMIGLLGALKAGGAYLPLDPSYPTERLAYMLENAQVAALLTQSDLRRHPAGDRVQLIELDREWEAISGYPTTNPGVEVREANLAYIIYTSGSTGRPKGVGITQAGMRNLALAQTAAFGIGSGAVVLQFASLGFDASVSEWTTALSSGAKLVLGSPGGTLAGNELQELLEREEVEVATIPPSVLTSVKGIGKDRVRTLVVAGEVCPEGLVREWASGRRMLDAYGPTETTVCATISGALSIERGAAIGGPINNIRVYVSDGCGGLTALGAVGEVYIGGSGLGRGYLNDAWQTAERFVPDGYSGESGSRLYRTGDEARWREDGELEYVGRLDTQVKVRGCRIELGEIEAALEQNVEVRQCAVMLREDEPGDHRLVAYVVPAGKEILSGGELRDYLRGRLPNYMLPSAFMVLERLPLTSNGKLDRKALPAPAKESPSGESAGPRTLVEEIVAGIFAEVLKLEHVGVDGNFFELGGHSLLATQVISRVRELLGVKAPLRDLFEKPTVKGLAESVEYERKAGRWVEAPPILPVSRDGELPLSFAQQRLWFIDQLEPGGGRYNTPSMLKLSAGLGGGLLENALSEVVRRHEVLRTRFESIEGRPVQIIGEASRVEMPVIDVSGLKEWQREKEARRVAGEEAARGFNLRQGPPLRAGILRLGEQDQVLLLTMHHVVSDEWSMRVLANEVNRLYAAYGRGESSPLEELPIQYADYAVWQRRWLQGETLEQQIGYWREQLEEVETIELPADHPRSGAQSYDGAVEEALITEETAQNLRGLSRRQEVTIFMLLMSAFKILLHRYCGQERIVVGTPIAGRNRLELEPLIGFFVNMLAIKTDLGGEPSIREAIHREREALLGAYAHQDVPFQKVVEEIQPERGLSRHPIFQVTFAYERAAEERVAAENLRLSQLGAEPTQAKYDLELTVIEGARGLTAVAVYCRALFDGVRVRRMLRYLRALLERMADDVDQKIGEIEIISDSEKKQILYEWNDTWTEYPIDKCVHELFAEQAERSPERIALISEKQQVSYGELNRRANQLGHFLQRLGVGPEVMVALCLERSVEMVVGMIGVLKAGGAYLPLDPGSPSQRLRYILQDVKAAIALTTPSVASYLPEGNTKLIVIDESWEDFAGECVENPKTVNTSDSLAYVIYTSGSTGVPKGVCVPNRAISRLVFNTNYVKLDATDVIAQVSNNSFDAATFEIWGGLLHGGRIAFIQREDSILPAELSARIEELSITTIFLTTALFNQIASLCPSGLNRVRTILFGGEKVVPECVRQILSASPSLQLLHVYGPTEGTTFSTWHPVQSVDEGVGTIPIGRPISNTTIYVLDPRLNPTPAGMIGELYIGGDGLAIGYYNQPEMTAEKFLPDRFGVRETGGFKIGRRVYRTGDLVRYSEDGAVEFIRRCDNQVKINGFRVEMSEIEFTLAQHIGVQQCVAQCVEDVLGSKRLVAYIVPTGERIPSNAELRNYIKDRLPDYMTPTAYVMLERLPLTANGKLDRHALSLSKEALPESELPYVAPQTEMEQAIASIWREALGVEKISINDNFFDLGGHSLLLARIQSKLQEKLGVALPLIELFENTTINALADRLSRKHSSPPSFQQSSARANLRRERTQTRRRHPR